MKHHSKSSGLSQYSRSNTSFVNKKSLFKRLTGFAVLSFGLMTSSLVFSAESAWQDIKVSAHKQLAKSELKTPSSKLKKFRALSLNEPLLKERLSMSSAAQARQLARSESTTPENSIITIPLPDGKSVRVQLEHSQVMAPGLAAKHPEIKTWKVTGVDDPRITGRVDFTTYGFHAMLTMPDGDTVFVERENKDSSAVYRSFSKRGNPESFHKDFNCGLHGNSQTSHDHNIKLAAKSAARRQTYPLLKYCLADAATGEYTQFHGGVRNALSAIVATINRVNEINERDLNIRFELIDDEEDIIYSNPRLDPYTNNQADVMMGENILNLKNTLGRSRYDIARVFTQGDPSGLAILGAACDETSFSRYPTASGREILLQGAKEAGITGSPTPDGDAFDIDFVAHELGHQLGGKHTFNSNSDASQSCAGENRTAKSAVEPGSGSTVMSYAGICGPNNLQRHSDAYYHTKSINEINGYMRFNSIGSSCGSPVESSNSAPEPDAKSDTVIPARTPFILTGSASDPDSNQELTYVWDQMDTGTASDVDVDTGDNALIRSLPPSSSATRYVPRLKDIFQQHFIRGESLPVASRELNFAFTVRDGRGGIETDLMTVTVSGTGRTFALTSHGSRRNLGVGQESRVKWDVAGTTSSPINCHAVNISLLQANGHRVQLESNTANDGSETVTIPSSALGMSGARMMVACDRPASTFFNISAADLTIVAQGRGEADTENNNGAGNPGGGSGGHSDSGGGGSLGIIYLLSLMLLVLLGRSLQAKKQRKLTAVRNTFLREKNTASTDCKGEEI